MCTGRREGEGDRLIECGANWSTHTILKPGVTASTAQCSSGGGGGKIDHSYLIVEAVGHIYKVTVRAHSEAIRTIEACSGTCTVRIPRCRAASLQLYLQVW